MNLKTHPKEISSAVILENVDNIGNYAFCSFSQLKSVRIQSKLTYIGAYSFSGCSKLSTIDFGNYLQSIAGYAFRYCSLTQVHFPTSIQTLAGRIFQSSPKLTSITFEVPSNLHTINNNAFEGISLRSITLPDSLVTSGTGIFYNTPIEKIKIGPMVTNLSPGPLGMSPALIEIEVDILNPKYEGRNNAIYLKGTNTLIQIPTGLNGVYHIPKDVEEIAQNAFFGAQSISEIICETNLTKINDSAFRSCIKLVAFHLSSSVKSIGKLCFEGCISLTSFFIPLTLETLGEGAFSGCKSLPCVDVADGHPLFSLKDDILYSAECKTLIFCPQDKKKIVIEENATSIPDKFFSGSKMTTLMFSSRTVSLGTSMCEDCNSLKSIFIPKSVKTAGAAMFMRCKALVNVTYEDNSQITAVSYNTYLFCYQLKTVNFGKNSLITGMGLMAFSRSGIETITIPPKTTNIGELCFQECTFLRSITIRGANIALGRDVFTNCNSLRDIYLGVETIRTNSFMGITGLVNLHLFSETRTIETTAFSNCEKLENILFTACFGDVSTLVINSQAFAYCASLASVQLPANTTEIAPDAFAYCTSLLSITFENSEKGNQNYASFGGAIYTTDLKEILICPAGSITFKANDKIETIGPKSFYGCTLLSHIVLGEKLRKLSDFCFYGCIGLKQVNIPMSTREMGAGPFEGCANLKTIFFCADDDNVTLTTPNPISDKVEIIVPKTYKKPTFLDHLVIKSSSIGEGGCPNRPSAPFSQPPSESMIGHLFLRASRLFAICFTFLREVQIVKIM